jgi:y4mF family transcriptional regulator
MDAGELGRAIRTRRRALGLSQLELAELADVGTRFVHEVESGSGNPRLRGLIALCHALGLELTVDAR